MTYKAYLCGPSDCPHDPEFVHESYPFGCVPRDFSTTTGRSKTHKQALTVIPGLQHPRWQWDGGCDKAGVTAKRLIAEATPSMKAKP